MALHSRLFSRWQWLLLALLLLLFLFCTEYLVYQERQRQQQVQLRHVAAAAAELRALLESEVNSSLYLSQGLAAYIQASHGQVRDEEFAFLLPNLVAQGRHIRNIGIAPDNRISFIYPLVGNEKALGLYYPDLSEQWPDIANLIQARQSLLVGPVQLAQGGLGFIHRIPVYLPDDRYWGIVSTVLDIESVWVLLRQQAAAAGVKVALRRMTGAHWADMLVGDMALFQDDAMLFDLTISGAKWQLAAVAAKPLSFSAGLSLRLFGWLVSCLLLSLMAVIFIANGRLAVTARAREQSEAYASTVLDNVADAIVVLDRLGRIDKINRAAQTLLGYQGSAIQGQPYRLLFAGPVTLADIEAGAELEVMHQNGQAILVELMLSHIQEPQQGGFVLLLRDIRERKRVEQLKNEFVSTVSHELRTPLTAINGALGLLAAGAVGAVAQPQQQLLDIARQNCAQLATLINDLLDIEKLTAGKMLLQLQPLGVKSLLLEAKNRNLPLAQQSGISLVIQSDISADSKVLVDESRLQQVFANLLANAIRFSPAQGEVQLQAVVLGQKVRISVLDRGPGVPADFIPRLFQKFSQADSSDTRRLSGTGLGLAICKELVERMGGDIGYQANAEGGACFYFELDLV
ncbi:ATP-binding protein [Rheinheimera sp.]|uniref:ATP-binding protein n=1 Tax=Rheinheimera sp. TaxID=1869214 RepID=UPI0027B894E8|nr:ATP-binding protein [Rheinheimera sp.]